MFHYSEPAWLIPAGVSFRNDGQTIEALRNKLLDLSEQAQTIQAKADAEKRGLLDDEQAEIDGIFAEFEATEADIARRERIEAQTSKVLSSAGRQSEPAQPGQPAGYDSDDAMPQARQTAPRAQSPASVRRVGDPVMTVRDRQAKGGFRGLGEFATAVRAAASRGSVPDPRLIANAATSYGNEGVGADGGFAVPPDFRTEIMQSVMGETSLLSRCDVQYTSSNTLILPKDETTAWGSNGIQAYWEGEGSQMTQSKPALGSVTVRLNKLTALVPVTEEMMEDAPGLDNYLRRKVAEVFDFKLNLAILQGDGVGKPLGILNAGSTVSVAKESGQTADTIVKANIDKVWNRMLPKNQMNAVWICHPDIMAQLDSMVISGPGTNPNIVPVYLPAGGLSASPYATLKGRPIIPSQACETLGDKGDLFLCDMSQYLVALRSAGMRADVSMHLWFDYDLVAYRFVMRMGGMPWRSSAVAARDGTTTYSPFVTLDERA